MLAGAVVGTIVIASLMNFAAGHGGTPWVMEIVVAISGGSLNGAARSSRVRRALVYAAAAAGEPARC